MSFIVLDASGNLKTVTVSDATLAARVAMRV